MASRSIADPEFWGLIRFATRVLLMAVAMLIAVPMHLSWRAMGLSSPWPRFFLGAVGRICGARVSTRGTRLRRDVFYVSNHLGWIEDPVLGGLTGAAFVAQDAIASWPLVGWLAKLNNTIFVSRTDRLAVTEQIETLRAALDNRQPIVVYPEGTTTDGRSLLPFKPSLFEVMCPPPRPMMVQPVLLDFGAAGPEIAWVGDETMPENTWRLLTRPGTFRLVVNFLDPFDPTTLPDRKAIAAEARQRIAAALSKALGGVAIV